MLKISHRAYILIAVPLCFEIVFVSALIFTQEQLNGTFREQSQLKETLSLLGGVLKNLPQCATDLGLAQFTHSKSYRQHYDQTIAELRSAIKDLKAINTNDPLIDSLAVSIEKAIDNVRTSNASLKSENQFEIVNVFKSYQELMKEVMTTAQAISKRQQARIDAEHLQEEKLRKTMVAISIAGVSISIMLSLIIAYLFHKMLVEKIFVLRTNGQKLAAGLPLLPKLEGDDELSQLDSGFRKMADDLAYFHTKEMALLNNAIEVICSLDSEGRFKQVNNAISTILKYDSKEIIGRSIFSIAATSPAQISENMQKVVSSRDSKPFQIAVKRADSSVCDLLWSMTWNEKEKTFFCVAHDVTERNAVDQLKRDMIAMVSHDLRSPLTALQVYFEMFANGNLGVLNDKGKQKSVQATGIIRRLVMKINALLDIERLESGSITLEVSEQSLAVLVDRASESVQGLMDRKHMQLIINCPEGVQVSCDPERLIDVIINLMHNAVKFSPDRATLAVSVVDDGQEFEVRVADEGKGVAIKDRELIFERFRQSQSDGEVRAQGSGLGLAIAKSVIVAHGGTIGVRSNEPNGSVFWFTIPKIMNSSISQKSDSGIKAKKAASGVISSL